MFVSGAQAAHELSPPGAGHKVIGDDQADMLFRGTEQGHGTFRRGGDGDSETGIAENGFADLQLNEIVVDQKNLAQNAGSGLEDHWSEAGQNALRAGSLSSPAPSKRWRTEQLQRSHSNLNRRLGKACARG